LDLRSRDELEERVVRFLRHPIVRWVRRFGARLGVRLLFAAGLIYAVIGSARLLEEPWAKGDTVTNGLFGLSIVAFVGSALRIRSLDERSEARAELLGKERVKNQRIESQKLLEGTLKPMLSAVAKGARLNPMSLGCCVWLIPKEIGAGLEMAGSFQFHNRPPSGVSWTTGKGSVGRCWAEKCMVVADLAPLHNLSKLEFQALDEEIRLGLSLEDFRATEAYWAVWAIPSKDLLGTLIGCVSIDCDDQRTPAAKFSRMTSKGEDKVIIGYVDILSRVALGARSDG